MLPGPNYCDVNSARPVGHNGLAINYESFEARFRDLGFLEGANATASGATSSGPQTCGWTYGCLANISEWFDRYLTPGVSIRDQPPSFGTAPETLVNMAFDNLVNPAHAAEADTMVRTAHAIPAALAASAGGFERSFGCFVAGTEIATERGPVPVENLSTGNLVHTVRDGCLKPILWTGHRTIDCQRHPRPSRVWPIRISASAFGPDLPQRDLLLSPDHAVYWIDALIPVRCLVNDRTVAQMPVTNVTYFHLELAQHDVVLADGLPAETYLDTGAEGVFYGHGSPIGLYPDLASRLWDAKACAPLLVTGPVIDSLRQWLGITASPHRMPAAAKINPAAPRRAKSA